MSERNPGTVSSLVPDGLGGRSGMSESADLLPRVMLLSRTDSSFTVPNETL